MAEIRTYECDIATCRKLRKDDANHWFRGYLLDRDSDKAPSGVLVLPIEVQSVSSLFGNTQHPLPAPDAHLCGIECAQKWVAQQLDKLRQV